MNTYDDLVKAVISWSHRKDILTLIPQFIQMAEYEMFNNAQTQLMIRETETISTASTTGRFLELPPNFEKARSVQLVTGQGYVQVKFQTPTELLRQPTVGMPRFFSVVGNELEFEREPDSEYTIEVQYYKKPDPITEENQTNVVLDDYSSIYLFGTLAQVYLWSQDTEEAAVYTGKFQDAIKGANKADNKARYGPTPAMRVNGVTP